MSPDGMRAHIIPDDSDVELIEEKWYTPPHMKESKPPIKRIRFSSDTKPPTNTERTVSSDFEIGQYIVYSSSLVKKSTWFTMESHMMVSNTSYDTRMVHAH